MSLKVLFIHGLESGPTGRKARHLQAAGFVVEAALMPCGSRAVRRDVWAWPWVVAAALGRPRRLTERVWSRSLAVQRQAVADSDADVLVASSFGGAIAVTLLAEGLWTGPALLLCPATRLVAERLRRPLPALPDREGLVVVHGRADAVVPFADSERLVAGTRARLVAVDDDHPLTQNATPEGLAGWIAMTGVRT